MNAQTNHTHATDRPAEEALVKRLVRPCAWRWGAKKLRGVEWRYAARNTRADAEPLYNASAIEDAAAVGARLGAAAERERIRAHLMEMHERDKGAHNFSHWRCAIDELFGA